MPTQSNNSDFLTFFVPGELQFKLNKNPKLFNGQCFRIVTYLYRIQVDIASGRRPGTGSL